MMAMAGFNIIGINTIIIQVKNLERSIHFYENVLQLNKDIVDENMAFFRVGTDKDKVTVLLHTVDAPQPSDKGMVIELLVDDVEAAVSFIKSAGGEILRLPVNQDWGVRE